MKGYFKTLAVANQKGGVGKTTTAINLGTALAAIGIKVVIFDFDAQANAATGLGVSMKNREITTYDVVTGVAGFEEAVQTTEIPDLFIIPGHENLAGLDTELAQDSRRAMRMKDAISAYRERADRGEAPDYDLVLIDCPPSLSTLTVNSMAAADGLIVPLQCEFFALEGLTQLLRTILLVKRELNPRLEIQGVVLTMFDRRNNLSAEVAAEVRAQFGERVYETVIPRNIRLSEAPSFGKPALLYDHNCPGSQAYLELAREVAEREKLEIAA